MIFKTLENVDHPLLGPTLYGLSAWGMWQQRKGIIKIIFNSIHIFAIIFVLSQFIELWKIRSNLEMAMRNLSVSMLSSVCVVKAGTFIIWQNSWKRVIDYVSTLEKKQLSKNDATTTNIIKDYISYSRKVTYFYWGLVTATVLTLILAPLGSFIFVSKYQGVSSDGSTAYPEIMSSWVPFDKSKGVGYWVLLLEHSFICCYGGGIVAHYDSNAVVLMNFFAGQLKVLKSNCERLFEESKNNNNITESMNRIRDCHLHHINLIEFVILNVIKYLSVI